MKIALIGHPGSGKTYLASKLGYATNIEVIDIDNLFDRHPLYFLSRNLYRKQLNKLLQGKESWIIDGYHGKRMPDRIWQSADLIIFLDLTKPQLRKNILSRNKDQKSKGESSHWQGSRLNNIKNLCLIRFFDKSLRKNHERITRLALDPEYITLASSRQVDGFVKLCSNSHR